MTDEEIASIAKQVAREVFLIERLEAATGPDRELDVAIQKHIGTIFMPYNANPSDWLVQSSDGYYEVHRVPGGVRSSGDRFCLRYTASIDAALTLVPEGWQVDKLAQGWRCGLWACQLVPKPSQKALERFDRGETIGYRTADAPINGGYGIATPALAICIAALRARSEGEGV